MGTPTSLVFEVKGGSPTVLDVTMPNGEIWEVRVTPSVMEISHDPEQVNPIEPGKPVFQMQVSMGMQAKKK